MPLPPSSYLDSLSSSSGSSSLRSSNFYSNISVGNTDSHFRELQIRPQTTDKNLGISDASLITTNRPYQLSKVAVICPSGLANGSSSSTLPTAFPLMQSPSLGRFYPQETASNKNLYIRKLDDELASRGSSPKTFSSRTNFFRNKERRSLEPAAPNHPSLPASSYLGDKISRFLEKTDHVMNEWKKLGKDKKDNISNLRCSKIEGPRSLMEAYKNRSLSKSKSATNILIKGFKYFGRTKDTSITSESTLRLDSEDRTISGCDEVAWVYM